MTGPNQAQPKTLLSVQQGRLVISPGQEPAELHIPAELPLVVTIDGNRATGRETIVGTEEVSIAMPTPVEGSWSIAVDGDGMAARLELQLGSVTLLNDAEPSPRLTLAVRTVNLPPPDLTKEAILAALAKAGVTRGVDEEALEEAVDGARSGRVVVARGKEPTPGEDGRLEVLVSTLESQPYIEREDGSIDFRDRPEIPAVEEGTAVARIYPPTPGTPGETVQGRELPARAGRPVAVVPRPGVKAVEEGDNILLIATRLGRPEVQEVRPRRYRVDVSPVYTVSGDVDMSSGNIRFNGDVEVRGDVKEGFSVQAVGTVTVRGSVFDAQIVSAGGIVVKGAAMGSRLVTQDGAGIEVGRVHQSQVHSGDWIKIGRQGIYFSTVKAKGDVAVAGAVVGGTLEVEGGLARLREAGSRLGAETLIQIPEGGKAVIDLAHPGVKVRVGRRLFTNGNQRRHWVVTADSEQ